MTELTPTQLPFEERYLEPLMNIEMPVLAFYDNHTDLTDVQVDAVYEALTKRYRAEETNFDYAEPTFDGLRDELHELLLPIAETLRGRPALLPGRRELSAAEMQAIFKRLRASIKMHSKRGGRQGYLKFLDEFMRGADFGALE